MLNKNNKYTNQSNKYAISIKRIRQPKHQVRHLNQKSTPTKTPSTPSQSKEYATKTPNTQSQSKEYANVNFSPQYWFTLFCRETIIVANLRTFWRTIWSSENCAGVQKMTNHRYACSSFRSRDMARNPKNTEIQKSKTSFDTSGSPVALFVAEI